MARNKGEMEITEDAETGGSRVYELGFHLDPELPTEEVKSAYQTIKAVIEGEGSLVAEGEPVQTALAYTISRQEPSGRRDFDSAYFAWVAYETSAANHEKVLDSMKLDKRVIRFIDVITTKEAARHAAELAEMRAKVPPAAESPVAADAELDAALESVAV